MKDLRERREMDSGEFSVDWIRKFPREMCSFRMLSGLQHLSGYGLASHDGVNASQPGTCQGGS